jgi:hypothetical protein
MASRPDRELVHDPLRLLTRITLDFLDTTWWWLVSAPAAPAVVVTGAQPHAHLRTFGALSLTAGHYRYGHKARAKKAHESAHRIPSAGVKRGLTGPRKMQPGDEGKQC